MKCLRCGTEMLFIFGYGRHGDRYVCRHTITRKDGSIWRCDEVVAMNDDVERPPKDLNTKEASRGLMSCGSDNRNNG